VIGKVGHVLERNVPQTCRVFRGESVAALNTNPTDLLVWCSYFNLSPPSVFCSVANAEQEKKKSGLLREDDRGLLSFFFSFSFTVDVVAPIKCLLAGNTCWRVLLLVCERAFVRLSV
jgi:hypothetical protein